MCWGMRQYCGVDNYHGTISVRGGSHLSVDTKFRGVVRCSGGDETTKFRGVVRCRGDETMLIVSVPLGHHKNVSRK